MTTEIDEHIENIKTRGYTVLENIIDENECNLISQKLDSLEKQQEEEFGRDRLLEINELGIVRALIEKDDYFQNLILNQNVFKLVSSLIKDTAILHLQNGVILHPEKKHGQAHFHRDITFLDFVSDKKFQLVPCGLLMILMKKVEAHGWFHLLIKTVNGHQKKI